MKRSLSKFLAAFLVAGLIAGCGSGSKSPDPQTPAKPDTQGEAKPEPKPEPAGPLLDPNKKYTVVHWQHHSDARHEMVQKFAADFMNQYPNVTVEIESIPIGDYWNKLVTTVASGQGPDVFQIPAGKAQEFVVSDQLQPISSKVLSAEQIKADFLPATLVPFTSKDKIYGLPTDTQTIVMIWNKDLFKEAGLDPEAPPKSWEQVVEYATKITKFEDGKMVVSGLGLGGYHPVINTFMYQNGLNDLMNADGTKYEFANDPAAKEAFQWYNDLVTKHKVYDPNFGSRWTGFRAGKVGMVFAHPAMMGNFKVTAPDVKWGVSEVPERKGSQTNIVTSWGYVVAKKADPEASSLWVDYLTNETAQKKWTAQTGELPARTKLLDDPELSADPNIKVAFESLKKAKVSRLNEPAYDPLTVKAWNQVILEGKSSDEALKWLEDELNSERRKKGL